MQDVGINSGSLPIVRRTERTAICRCPCQEPFTYVANGKREQKYLDPEHYAAARRRAPGAAEAPFPQVRRWKVLPQGEFQRCCVQYADDNGLSLSGLARLAGIPPTAFKGWLHNTLQYGAVSTMAEARLARLAEVVGIPLEQAIAWTGGRTAEQRRHELGVALTAEISSEERRRRCVLGGSSRKGQAKPREHTKGIVDYARSEERRVLGGLLMRLVHGWPSKGEIPQRWESDIASKQGLPRRKVGQYLRPHLQRRGLRVKPGRGVVDGRRWLQIEQLMATWPRDQDGDLPDGFWKDAWRQTGSPAIRWKSLRRGFYRWQATRRAVTV